MRIDWNLSTEENLCNLLNVTIYGYVFDPTKVIFSGVTTITPSPGSPFNSELTVTAIEGKGFRGSKRVKYNRLSLMSGREKLSLGWQGTAIEEDRPIFANRFAVTNWLVPEHADMVGDYPINVDDRVYLTYIARPESLLYIGVIEGVSYRKIAPTDDVLTEEVIEAP